MENKQLEVINDNIIRKIVKFFKNIFYKQSTQTLNTNINLYNPNCKSEFIDEIKLENEENSKIMKLQKQVENNEINLELLSKEEITALDLLYNKQISNLNKKLKERELEYNLLIKELNI